MATLPPKFAEQVGKGRPKGSTNKTTALAKNAIAEAADKLGGVQRLVEWAQEDAANERVFWGTIYPKLLPLQVGGDPDGVPINTTLAVSGLSENTLREIAALS